MESELCMKCGREVKPGQVFCDECLEEMEKYPVKPGVVVLLPHRPAAVPKPSPKRRHPVISPEEQVVRLKQRVTRLTLALILATAVALGAGWLVVSDLLKNDEIPFLPGQNYSSEQSTHIPTGP